MSAGPKGKGKGETGKEESSGGDSANLKEREYRDASGQVHQHTKKYMEQHGGAGAQQEGGSQERDEEDEKEE